MSITPADLRRRLEATRRDLKTLFRSLDLTGLPFRDIPREELRALGELDADCAEALWALDQPPGSLDAQAMVRDTLASLERIPAARGALLRLLSDSIQKQLPVIEEAVRPTISAVEIYEDIPRTKRGA